MMDLAETLRKIMREQYGIETDAQLIEASEHAGLDIGIFVVPFEPAAREREAVNQK